MTESKFKTMRHIETVRNYLNTIIKEFMRVGEVHDQSKMEAFEVEAFEKYTPMLKGLTYGSQQYKDCLSQMKPTIDHHYKANASHHPEGNEGGISGMTLLQLTEMIIDWKASGLRHADGCIYKSIEINQKRFGYSDELKQIFINTAKWLDSKETFHKANES